MLAPYHATIRERFRFFHGNGGVIVGEQAKYALRAAKREHAARDRADIRFVWIEDTEADITWDDDGSVARKLESGEWVALGCVLERRTCERCDTWAHVSSLWGIIGPEKDPYRRVIEAELLSELEEREARASVGLEVAR